MRGDTCAICCSRGESVALFTCSSPTNSLRHLHRLLKLDELRSSSHLKARITDRLAGDLCYVKESTPHHTHTLKCILYRTPFRNYTGRNRPTSERPYAYRGTPSSPSYNSPYMTPPSRVRRSDNWSLDSDVSLPSTPLLFSDSAATDHNSASDTALVMGTNSAAANHKTDFNSEAANRETNFNSAAANHETNFNSAAANEEANFSATIPNEETDVSLAAANEETNIAHNLADAADNTTPGVSVSATTPTTVKKPRSRPKRPSVGGAKDTGHAQNRFGTLIVHRTQRSC